MDLGCKPRIALGFLFQQSESITNWFDKNFKTNINLYLNFIYYYTCNKETVQSRLITLNWNNHTI